MTVRIVVWLGAAALLIAGCTKEKYKEPEPTPTPDPVEPEEDAGPALCGKDSFRNASPGFCVTPPTPFRVLGTKAAGDERVREIEVAGMGTFELEWGPVASKENDVKSLAGYYASLGVKAVTLPSGTVSYKARVAGYQVASALAVSGDMQIMCHAPVLAREDAAAYAACETLVTQSTRDDPAQTKLDRDAFMSATIEARSTADVEVTAAQIGCEKAEDCGIAKGCQRSIVANKASVKVLEAKLKATCEKRAMGLIAVLSGRSEVACTHGVCEESGPFSSGLGRALASMSRNGPHQIAQRAVETTLLEATVPKWMNRRLATGPLRRHTGLRLCYAGTLHPAATDMDLVFKVDPEGNATATLETVAPELRACAEAALADHKFFGEGRPATLRFKLRLEPGKP